MQQKSFIYLIILLLNYSNLFGQALNDFGTISSGSYSDVTIWRQWDGVGWNTIPATFPNGSTQNVFIRQGHTVTLPTPGPYNVGNLTVQTGGKLYTNNTTTNIYLSVWGTNIVCDGEIGNGLSFDGISFNIDGSSCTVSGLGNFTASRIRKNNSTINPTTTLIVATDITLRWDLSSNTQFYNNTTGPSNFNLTINTGCTLNCEGSPGNPGNFSMDGVFGTSTAESGGQISVFGTLVIPGIMYATTNNITNSVNLVIGSGGILKVAQINSPVSGTALSRLTVQNGGKLELTGLGFPVGTANWSLTNNRYDFAVNSTVEYSALAAQNVLTQSDFQSITPGNNQYWHLIVSGSGVKTIRSGVILTARGNITITGSAILNQSTNNVDIQLGGNWTNYSSSAFQESLTKFVRFYGNTFPTQEIFCPGGEQFQNLIISKSSSSLGSKVRMLSPVIVNNQLTLGQSTTFPFGILELNGNSLTLNRPDSAAIRLQGPVGYNRYIIAEDPTLNSIVNWNIGINTGSYLIPFGINASEDTIPFSFVKTTTDNIGTLSVSTYGTPPDNLPWPSGLVNVTNLNSTIPNNNLPDNRDWTVDRFWYIGSTNPITGLNVNLVYNNRTGSPTEKPTNGNDSLRAQYWTQNGWSQPQLGVPNNNSVSITDLPTFNTAWTLTSISSPLPIELGLFDVEKKNGYNRVEWITISEKNNDFFELYSSNDGYYFKRITKVLGSGNSNVPKQYTYDDYQNCNDIIYYKLRQVDYNGNYEDFGPIFVNCSISKKIVKICNILGQEVTEDYDGVKIYFFDDRSILKKK